jgi:glycosyltransferase involved in cell wall biosynthesis
VNPFDARALGEGILGLLRDPARAAELGAAGREALLRRFTIERLGREFDAEYALARRAAEKRREGA